MGHCASKVVVGSYAAADEAGIQFFDWDATAGELSPGGGIGGIDNPSYVLPDPARDRLFAVGETTEFDGKPTGSVAMVKLDGGLSPAVVAQVASGGGAPCYLALNASQQSLLVANYGGGNVASVPLSASDDSFGGPTAIQQHTGQGPKLKRQEAAHAHSFVPNLSGDLAYAADLGCDAVFAYRVSPGGDTLTPRPDLTYRAAAGAGPRHLTFAASGNMGYLLNELNSTIDVLAVQGDGGLACQQTVSLLPPDWSGQSIAAEVQLHPSGRWLYASNRGHNSLAVFKVDSTSGKLTWQKHVSTHGSTPRNFRVSPDGRHVIVANQDSDSLVVFTIDPAEGVPHQHGKILITPQPTCVQFW